MLLLNKVGLMAMSGTSRLLQQNSRLLVEAQLDGPRQLNRKRRAVDKGDRHRGKEEMVPARASTAVKVGDPDTHFIEAILKTRFGEGKPQHLIHWKGYRNKESTWELAEHLLQLPAEQDEHEVEAVVHSRFGNGKMSVSWEPAENLENASDKVAEYRLRRPTEEP